jgi:hypothetical protein
LDLPECGTIYVLGIYFKQHDEAELEQPDSAGSGNPSSVPSLPLGENLSYNSEDAGNTFTPLHPLDQHKVSSEQSCPYPSLLQMENSTKRFPSTGLRC